MKTNFLSSFAKDLKKHERDKDLLVRVHQIILEIETAESLSGIKK